MTKIKTHQATVKRFVRTKKGKILKRRCGQDHFNARESGNTTRNKRRDLSFSPVYRRTIEAALPN